MCTAAPALAWDAYGHRLIATVAMEGAATRLGSEAPAWMKDKAVIAAVAEGAVTPDRWRSIKTPQLTHLNNPDHYVDIEELADYGMSLQKLPPLRHEYVRQLTLAREKPDFKGPPINPAMDPDHVREYPGFLPHAATETWGKAVGALRTVRILEQLHEPARAGQLEAAKAAAIYNMGVLAHYAGDAAQPLHTTVHHHGWVGDNPGGYTTDRKIHSYIDGGVLKLHNIKLEEVRKACTWSVKPDPDTPWDSVISELDRSFAKVEPLYQLRKSGDLDRAAGKAFIVERLADGADTLSALYAAAWTAAAPTQKDVEEFVRYDNFDPAR